MTNDTLCLIIIICCIGNMILWISMCLVDRYYDKKIHKMMKDFNEECEKSHRLIMKEYKETLEKKNV